MFPAYLNTKLTKSHARLRPETLKGAQAALWSTLPPSYREFLCRWNGGVLEEGQLCFDTPIPYVKDGRQVRDHQTDSVVEFFGFQPPGETREPRDLATVKPEHDAEEFLPLGVIAIAECLGNSLLCLSTRSEDYGIVYYWDYYWKYPWSRPFFEPRIQAAKREFPDLDAIRADPLHPRRREAVDTLNYASLVRLAEDLESWLSMCRPDDHTSESRPANSLEKAAPRR